jgi:hypothetical protein
MCPRSTLPPRIVNDVPLSEQDLRPVQMIAHSVDVGYLQCDLATGKPRKLPVYHSASAFST